MQRRRGGFHFEDHFGFHKPAFGGRYLLADVGALPQVRLLCYLANFLRVPRAQDHCVVGASGMSWLSCGLR